MLYYVKSGDTLSKIARQFNTTVNSILNANTICNPNLIFPGEPLIIPRNDVIYRAGATPYYIVQPGDSLWCLYRLYNIPINVIAEVNNIQNPNILYPGTELLIGDYRANPEELKETWENTGGVECDLLSPLQIHGIYYIGSFSWEALGTTGIPYLLDLLNHPCDIVRSYTALSLGRIGLNESVTEALTELTNDPSSFVADIARLAIKRINLTQEYGKRIHVTIEDNRLYNQPNLNSQSIILSEGSEIIVLKWNIPSPTYEEGPRGDLQVYDYVQVVNTGQVGFLPRVGFNEIRII
ncbi:HEAT repeat domain-containing protein [Thermohalobacter berrensis]|uniref:LysM domain-containing protein n=1 Tax=Thermohalobacter berrensis TaxID=99594 RepID=A0A419T6C1_9FIRM|nr:HEAT repeat domain-containing protein [Thermohalobacter berrensis]RKD33157.1 hypothetical protein BET03_09565 [Thermohalobacter berrensis]